MNFFTLTRFTATKPSRLSKAFRFDAGRLVKESGGQMFEGKAEKITVDVVGFSSILAGLTPC